MKQIYKLFFLFVVAGVLLSIGSCEVTCDAGYEGKGCITATNTKFAGTYTVTDSVTGAASTQVLSYSMVVLSPANSPAGIRLVNLHNIGMSDTAVGTVSGTSVTGITTTIAIPNDTINFLFGSGSINNNILDVTYSFNDTTGFKTCHAIGQK